MSQQVIPDYEKYPDIQTLEERKSLRIKPADKITLHSGEGIQGFFRMGTGEIFLSTFLHTVSWVLSHELIHKILYEELPKEDNPLKSTIMWDIIAKDIEEYLFDMEYNKWLGKNYSEAIKKYGSEENYLKIIGVIK